MESEVEVKLFSGDMMHNTTNQKMSDICHQVIRGWLARVFHKVEGEEVEVTNFCFDTIQGDEQEDLPRNSFVATRDMVGVFENWVSSMHHTLAFQDPDI